MFFNEIQEGAPDPIFGMLGAFETDVRPQKINLMVGVFKDEHLRSELLPVVRQVKEKIRDLLADYLPMDGLPEFGPLLGELIFGKQWDHGRIYAAQTIGGTGALRVGAEFLAQEVGRKVYLPQPTWGNHRNIFERAGFKVETIPYYSQALHAFDAESYLRGLAALEPKSVAVFHAACHNPTGSDPSLEEWKQISDICKERKIMPFFDFAYQGLGEGMEEDAKVVRLFLERGHEMLIAYSCSKNFSLYCQRVGGLFIVGGNPAIKSRIGSQVKRIIRALYSNPPAHGGRIVCEILKNPTLAAEWRKEVEQMRQRIGKAQESLAKELISKSPKRDFSFLRQRKGMFTYLDLDKAQVHALIEKHAIYTLDSGRISVPGLTSGNIDTVANSVIAVCDS